MNQVLKTIHFQVKVQIWQDCQAQFLCPEGETDEETYARIRQEGALSAVQYDDTSTLLETEEPIPDQELGTPHTFDFTGGSPSDEGNIPYGVIDTEPYDPDTEV